MAHKPFGSGGVSRQMLNIMQIAFLGLGIMGRRMAQNLLAGYPTLRVWNRSPEPRQALADAGAQVADTPAAAVQNADVVITMLAHPEAVAEVAWGEGGFLPHVPAGALWMDCSTVNPSFIQQAAQQAQAHGVRLIDAPVAGSKPQAEAAQLAFLVGGAEADVNQARPLMEQMGRNVLHVGPLGHGGSLKMLVNAMLAQSMVMFAEAVQLGERMGLDRTFLLDTLPQLPVAAPFLQAKAEKIKAGDYDAQFPLALMHKDLHLAALTAYEQGQPLYLANLAKELYADAARDERLAWLDFAAVYRSLARKG